MPIIAYLNLASDQSKTWVFVPDWNMLHGSSCQVHICLDLCARGVPMLDLPRFMCH
jgi:hypothetical protein